LLGRYALNGFECRSADRLLKRILRLTQPRQKPALPVLKLMMPIRRRESLILQGSDYTSLSTLQSALPVRRNEPFILDRSQDATLSHIKTLGQVVDLHFQVTGVLWKLATEADGREQRQGSREPGQCRDQRLPTGNRSGDYCDAEQSRGDGDQVFPMF
jgi:hypothetical protein